MKAKSEKRRAFIGNQIDECRDASGLFYILGFQKVISISYFDICPNFIKKNNIYKFLNFMI